MCVAAQLHTYTHTHPHPHLISSHPQNIDIENAPAPLLFPKPGEEKRFARLKNDPSRLAQCQEFRRKFLEKYPEDWVYSEVRRETGYLQKVSTQS